MRFAALHLSILPLTTKPTMSKKYKVCKASELKAGERKIIDAGKKSIGVFNIEGKFYALRNVCPHQMAPLCEGSLSGTTLPGPVGEFNYGHQGCIIRCPWHGWEFNVTNGRSVFNPHKMRVKSYQVTVEKEDGATSKQTISADDEDPQVETYPVSVEQDWVVVHV